MNKHFTKDYDIITDTASHTPTHAGDDGWLGIIPHTDFAVTSITIKGKAQLTGTAASDYVADIPVGLPFLCEVEQIQLSAGGCKMIKPN